MSLKDDLESEVATIFKETWSTRDGQTVPESSDVKLGNDAVKLDATVLYADMTASTKLVDSYGSEFAAEVYKAYLHCAAKIIRADGGTITAYDGDRIMAVYLGDSKNTSAAHSALKINWTRGNIINPALKKQYPLKDYILQQTVGIDTSPLFVARTGIRGSNDLVWVGRSANYAAKLAALSPSHQTSITAAVYNSLNDSMKTTDGKSMWDSEKWTDMNDITIYRSTWWQSF